MAVQRLRIRYGRHGVLQYVAHLDMMRLWTRLLRRAGIPVAYSGGPSPRPRLSIAAALPIGVTSEAELLDVFIRRRVSSFYFLKQIEQQLPQGLDVYEAYDVALEDPSLQSQVRQAEYHVQVPLDEDGSQLAAAIERFNAAESVQWEHLRETEVRRYDLRKLVYGLWLEPNGKTEAAIGMLLKTDPEASGRPDQVVSALGIAEPPIAIHRTKLLLAEPQRKSASRR